MKNFFLKYALPFFTIAFLIIVLPSQTKAPAPVQPPVRMITVTLRSDTWDAMLWVMDNTNDKVLHVTVRQIRDSLFAQFNDPIKNPNK